MSDPRRALPGVDAVLAEPELQTVLATLPRALVVSAVRQAIEEARKTLKTRRTASADAPPNPAGPTQVATRAAELATAISRPTLGPVLNATGVILHTNLGRAPLATVALERMALAAEGYTNLEFDLLEGTRGSRYTHCAGLLCELTGAEDALVVNNCAAALVLALNTAARGKAVVVSRGELIEIGGGFRIPEIVEQAGTHLIEVGTTNRTRIEDYRIGADRADAGVLLKVHRSNFRIEGFSEETDLPTLKTLSEELQRPLVYDLGSGLMLPLDAPGLPPEPTVPEAVAGGADLVVFSGDKLLGGPQAGILLGSREWVEHARKNPLTRALRVDRATLAALEATLELYRDPQRARQEVPALRMIHESADALRARADRLADQLAGLADAVPMMSVVGGGTLPGAEIPSWGLKVRPNEMKPKAGAADVARALRQGGGGSGPIVARVQDGAVFLDLRTIPPARDGDLQQALASVLR